VSEQHGEADGGETLDPCGDERGHRLDAGRVESDGELGLDRHRPRRRAARISIGQAGGKATPADETEPSLLPVVAHRKPQLA
jgi:hypothetical protein